MYLRQPAGYRVTEKDLAAMNAGTPEGAQAYVQRGRARMDRSQFKEAIDDFTKALGFDPKDEWALANRGMSRVWAADYAAAKMDLDAAQVINPENPVLWRARGLIAERNGRWAEAIDAYTQSLAQEDQNGFALGHRAIVQRAAGNSDAALADAASALKVNPRWTDLYLLRASLFRGRGDSAAGIKEAAALETIMADDGYAQVVAANIYHRFGRGDLALKAYDRAIAIEPAGYIYVNRGERRPKSDVGGRRADFAEAVRIDPDEVAGWIAKADLELKNGDPKLASGSYAQAIVKFPDNTQLLTGRGLAYDQLGDHAAAQKDFANARAKASQPVMLNNICWKKATFPAASASILESALVDCDAALKQSQDNPAYLDSRGLVFLRLGRLDDAIRDYDKVLSGSGDYATSLYGRALALAQKGDAQKAQLDRTAAIKLIDSIVDDFKDYGLPWPGEAH